MRDIMSPLDGVISPLRRRSGFNPLSLFAAGEVGVWYDPSDFTTMFQDSAGTTPVTAVEQPVGLILDKSQSLSLGAEQVTNGAFDSGTGWSVSAQCSISGGSARIVSTDGTFQSVGQSKTLTAGWYKLTVDIVSVSSGTLTFAFTGAGISTALGGAVGTKTTYFYISTSTSSTLSFGRTAGVTDLTIDNVSVKLIAGNHASQSTAASRPVLSARVNLLTYTESFSNVAWVQAGSGTASAGVKTNNFGTAPDGTQTAMRVQLDVSAGSAGNQSQVYQIINVTSGVSYKYSAWIKTNDGTTKTIMAFSGGTTSPTSLTVNGTWTRYEALRTVGGATDAFQFILIKGTTSDTADLLVWHPDARAASEGVNLPAYQRVGASTDYDTTGFPLYLKFDGVDDSLATGAVTINQPATAHVGARITNTTTTFQRFFDGVSGARMLIGKQSATQTIVFATGTGITFTDSFSTGVYTGTFNGASSVARLNGSQVGAGDVGASGVTGVRVGASNASAEFLAGNIYSLIIRGALSDPATISKTETWVNSKTGAF